MYLFSCWFLEVSGPPEFLNHAIEEPSSAGDAAQQQGRRSDRKDFKDKKDMPSGIFQSIPLFKVYLQISA